MAGHLIRLAFICTTSDWHSFSYSFYDTTCNNNFSYRTNEAACQVTEFLIY